MKELTEEQKKFLIEKMNQLPIDFVGAYADGFHMCRLNIKDILEKYTEKEFPNFLMNIHQNQRILGIRKIHSSITDESHISLINDAPGNYDTHILNFTLIEFKKFVEGCNKITEWLDEQEENNKC